MNQNPIISTACIEQGVMVVIGVHGTFNIRSQTFDLSAWVEAYGEGTATVHVQHPGETLESGSPLIYEPNDVTTEGNTLTWTFDAVDSGIAGYGACSVIYTLNGEKKAETPPIRTYIAQSLEGGAGVSPTPITDNYDDLANKPQINGHTLAGNQTGVQLGLVDATRGDELQTAIEDNAANLAAHVADTSNPHNVTKAQVGLVNVDNTSDADKPVSTAQQAALDALGARVTTNADAISGITAKIPTQASAANQLADKEFVNDAINSSTAYFRGSFASYAALMAVAWQSTDPTAENYVTNNDYAYVEDDETHADEAWRFIYVLEDGGSDNGWQPQFRVNESPLTVQQIAAIDSDITAALVQQIGTNTQGLAAHVANKQNPHDVTKAQVGLGNVDDTSDADKPVSAAQAAALALKAPLASPALTGTPTAPTAADGTATAQIATTAFVQSAKKLHSNPNLLDNWYFVGGGSQQGGGQFPINQRGQTSYGPRVYAIDRWTPDGKSSAIEVRPECIRIITYTNETTPLFQTYLEGVNSFLNKPVTLSALVRSDTATSARLNLFAGSTVRSSYISISDQWSLISFTYTFLTGSGDHFSAWINIAANATNNYLDVAAMKLEFGDTQTLAHQDENGNWVLNEIPNYQEQLARCQRYYQLFPSVSTIPGGVAPSESAPIKKEAFRPVMAKDITTSDYGTITIDGSTFYYADANL